MNQPSAPPASTRTAYADGKILLSVEQGVAVIRFNHPEKHNAMSVEMWEGLAFALTSARDNPETRVLILTGEGGKSFVSGADISQFERNQATPEARAEFGQRAGAYRSLLTNFPKPTISCIQGYCIGGGLGLALGTDIRIASSGSQFSIPAAKLSIAYPFSGLQVLNALVGPSWARLLLYSAMRIDAAEAERIGLITRQVSDDQLWPHTLALAHSIAANAPLSVYATKITVDQILKDPVDRDMGAIRAIAARCANSEDAKEGRRAFMEKRTPQFQGC